jgi:hypothetical protein
MKEVPSHDVKCTPLISSLVCFPTALPPSPLQHVGYLQDAQRLIWEIVVVYIFPERVHIQVFEDLGTGNGDAVVDIVLGVQVGGAEGEEFESGAEGREVAAERLCYLR